MTHTVDPATMDKSVPPPPCVIAGTPVEQATAQAKGFIDNVYHAMDSNMHSSIPFRADSIACFQKGAADRYQGPHIKAAVFREIDEDCGAPTAGAVQGDLFTKADTVAQQFAPFFYGSLDDPAKRGGLTSMFKGESYVTIGQDLFKGTQHIAHKMHYMPQLINPTARKIEGIDAIPSPASGGFFLFIHGACQLAGEDRQQRFVDLFHLVPEGSNFWISNLIMKVHGGV